MPGFGPTLRAPLLDCFWCVGIGVQGAGCRVQGARCRVRGLMFSVYGFGCREHPSLTPPSSPISSLLPARSPTVRPLLRLLLYYSQPRVE